MPATFVIKDHRSRQASKDTSPVDLFFLVGQERLVFQAVAISYCDIRRYEQGSCAFVLLSPGTPADGDASKMSLIDPDATVRESQVVDGSEVMAVPLVLAEQEGAPVVLRLHLPRQAAALTHEARVVVALPRLAPLDLLRTLTVTCSVGHEDEIGPLPLEVALRGLQLTWQGRPMARGSTAESLGLPPVADLHAVPACLGDAFEHWPLVVLPEDLSCSRFSAFFDDPAASDIVLRAQDGRQFHCSRLLLMAHSSYFGALLTGGMCESAVPQVTLQGVGSSTLCAALSHLYGRAARVLSTELLALLAFADMLGLRSLHAACLEAFLRVSSTDVGAALELLRDAPALPAAQQTLLSKAVEADLLHRSLWLGVRGDEITCALQLPPDAGLGLPSRLAAAVAWTAVNPAQRWEGFRTQLLPALPLAAVDDLAGLVARAGAVPPWAELIVEAVQAALTVL